MPILSVTRLAVLVGRGRSGCAGKAEAWRRNGGRVGEAATEAFVHLGMLSRVEAAAGQG